MGALPSPTCFSDDSGFFHMIQEYPRIGHYWSNVFSIFSGILERLIDCSSHIVVLDILEDVGSLRRECTLVGTGITIVKQDIAIYWQTSKFPPLA